MSERAWEDGPTWESIVRKFVRRIAESRKLAPEWQDGYLWVWVCNATGLGRRQCERLCRECGLDPITGKKVKP